MKKLIATAVVAAAAYGAFAIDTGVGFEKLPRGTTTVEALNTTTGNYWSEPQDATNTYSVSDFTAGEHANYAHPDAFANAQSTNALSIKTTFGKPLSFAVNAGATLQPIGDGIYFDSLIKFTVCEEAPETDYDGAKIALWLQEQYDEDDNIIGTNLMVKAGFLSIGENGVEVSNAVYKAGNIQINDGAFADKWHRVTIKTIADITEDADNVSVPGFVIYIDGNPTEVITIAATYQPKWDESFTYALNEIAENLNDSGYLFPSMVQGSATEKDTLKGVQFDGTGSINELVFTETEPWFANDEEYMDPKFTLQLGDGDPLPPFRTVADAIDAIKDLKDAGEYTLKLLENLNISESLVIDNADDKITIVLDLNGKTIINSAADTTYAITVTGGTSLTIIDSSANKNGMIVSVTDEDFGAIFLGENANFRLEAGTINGYISEDGASSMSFIGGSIDADSEDNVWNDEPGYKFVLNGETGFYDVVPLAYFDVTFMNGDQVYFTTNVVEGTLVADIVPADPTKDDYTFNGWGFEEGAKVTGNVTYTAQWTENASTPEIAPGEESVEVEYDASAKPEDVAAMVEIQTPEGVDKDDYQNLFTKKAEYNPGTLMWTVTAEIKAEVKEAVAQSAVDVLNGVESAKVEVPQGLFYKVTTMTQLGGTETPVRSGLSDGSAISVSKPGTTSGFIKILIGTKAYAE